MIVTRCQSISSAASRSKAGIGDLPPGKRDQRLAARVERALRSTKPMSLGDGIRHFAGSVIVPPFGLNHASSLRRARSARLPPTDPRYPPA